MYGAGIPETGEEVLTYLDLLTVQPPPGYPKKSITTTLLIPIKVGVRLGKI